RRGHFCANFRFVGRFLRPNARAPGRGERQQNYGHPAPSCSLERRPHSFSRGRLARLRVGLSRTPFLSPRPQCRRFDTANGDAAGRFLWFCPAPHRRAMNTRLAARIERLLESIIRRSIAGRKFAEPQRLVERGQSSKLLANTCNGLTLGRRIVMRLVEIQSNLVPRGSPLEPRRSQRDGNFAEFMNSLRNFLGKYAKIRQAHFCRALAMEFADGPLRLVSDFPGEQRRVRAKFPEQRNQDVFAESFASSGGLQQEFICVADAFPYMIMKPQKIKQGKTEFQPAVCRETEKRSNIFEQECVRLRGNPFFRQKSG